MRSGLPIHRHGVCAVTEFFTISKIVSKTLFSMAQKKTTLRPYVRTDYSTLISVRVETRTVKALDAFCRRYPIYNRSILVNRLLYSCVALASPDTFKQLINEFHPDPDEYKMIIQKLSDYETTQSTDCM